MSQAPPIESTTDRLLEVKRGLGHDLPIKEPPATDAPASCAAGEVSCVHCGYDQQGARVNRCPECGLQFASQMRDPTAWSLTPVSLVTWGQTALQVWSWNRRTRVRTAIIPTTPESWAFAKWSIALSGPLVGVAFAFFNWRLTVSTAFALGYAAVETILATMGSLLIMLLIHRGLRFALQGRWRRDLSFVPASIDYATAWWPLISVVLLCCGIAYAAVGPETTVPALLSISIVLAVWAGWLCSSVTESQNVRFVALRVAALILCVAVAGNWLLIAVSASSRILLKQLIAQRAPNRRGITYAVVLNITADRSEEKNILTQLGKLGVQAGNLVSVRGSECTLEQLEAVFATARSKLWPQDRFVFYVNCRGNPDEPDLIRMSDGVLRGDQLAKLLSASPTDHNLIIVEAERGDAILPVLKRTVSGVVVTSPDVADFKFNSGLKDFWETLSEPESDTNKDGSITVEEAFEAAYRPMLISLQTNREKLLRAGKTPGTNAPQLTILGKADPKAFRVPTPQPDKPQQVQPSPRPLTNPIVPPSAPWGKPSMPPPPRPLQY